MIYKHMAAPARPSDRFILLLSKLLWYEKHSVPIQYLFFFISNIQFVCLIILGHFQFIIPESEEYYSTFIRNLSSLVAYEKVAFFFIQRDQMAFVIIASGVYIATLLLGLIITIWNPFRGKRRRTMSKLLTKGAYFHFSVGFFVLEVILMFVIKTLDNSTSDQREGLFYSGIVFLILNNLLGVFCSFFCFDPFLSGNVFGCHSPTFQAIILIGKATIVPVFVFPDAKAKWIVIALIGLFVTLIRQIILNIEFPFYNFKGMKWAIIWTNIIGVFSFSLLIVSLFYDYSEISSTHMLYMQTILIPLVIKASLIDYTRKIITYLTIPDNHIKNEKQVLKRCLAISHFMNDRMFELHKDNINLLYMMNIISEHNKICKIPDCKCRFILWKDSSSKISPLGQSEIPGNLSENIVISLLNDTTKKFPNKSSLQIALAFLQLNSSYLSHPEQSALFSLQAARTDHSFFNKLCFLSLKSRIQDQLHAKYEEGNDGILNMKAFVEYHASIAKILEKMSIVTQGHLDFWQAYEKPDFTITKMLRKNFKVEKEGSRLSTLWDEFEKRYDVNSFYLYPKYALFLLTVRNAPYSAEKLMKKYRKKVFAKVHLDTMGELNNHSIQDRENIVVSISLGKKKAGTILDISSNISNLGWNPQELKGRSIGTILPPFFEENEHIFLSNILELQDTYKILDSTFPCFLKTKDGFLNTFNVHIALNPFLSNQVTYIAIFRMVRNNMQYMLIRKNGDIDCMTPELAAHLKVKGYQRINITGVCPTKSLHKITSMTTSNTERTFIHATSFQEERQILTLNSYVSALPSISERNLGSKDFLMKIHEISFKEVSIRVLELSPFGIIDGAKSEESEDPEQKSMNWTPPETEHQEEASFNFEISFDNMSNKEDNVITHLFKSKTLNLTGRMTTENKNLMTDNSEIVMKELRLANNTRNQLDLTPQLLDTTFRPDSGFQIKTQRNKDDTSNNFGSFDENLQYRHHLNVAQSVQSSTTRAKQLKLLEEAVYSVPTQRSALLINICAFLIFLLTGGLLVQYFLFAKDNFNKVKKNMSTMEESTALLTRILEIYKFMRYYDLTFIGLFIPNRVFLLDINDPTITLYISLFIEDAEKKFDLMQNSLLELEKSFKEDFYKREIPIVEDQTDGIMRFENLFAVTNQILVDAKSFVSRTTRGHFDRDLQFILQNTMNDYILAVESVPKALFEDIKDKINNNFQQNIIYLIVVVIVGILFLALFGKREKNFIKQKAHFLNMLSVMDDSFVERHLVLVQEAFPLIKNMDENENLIIKTYHRVFEDKVDPNSSRAKSGKLDFKRLISQKGLHRYLVVNAFLMTLFILLLISAFLFIHILFVSSGRKDNLLRFIETEFNTSYSYYEFKMLTSTIYELIQYDGNIKIRNVPIEQEWDRLYTKMLGLQAFLTLIADEYKNGTVRELIFDDLCQKLFQADSDICESFAGGAVTRGIIGINSYMLTVLKTNRDNYATSNKTILDKLKTLNNVDFIYEELIDLLFLISTYEVLIQTQIIETNGRIDQAEKHIILSIVIFIVIDAVFGILLWRIISKNIQNERTNWMKIMRRIPFNLVRTSKVLKSYLSKHRNAHFT